jgi:arylsulfatase A-like enzyme
MNRLWVSICLLLLTLAVVLSVGHAPGGAERGPDAESRPNVLLFVTDDQRDGTTRVMGDTRRLFGRHGVTYPNAYVTDPLCCPSRATILSGRLSHNHEIWTNERGSSFDLSRSIFRELQEEGYATSLFGKLMNGWRKPPIPYVDHAELGFFDGGGGSVEDALSRSDDHLLERVSAYLEERDQGGRDGQPWLMVVGTHTPHEPFVPAARYRNARVPAGAVAGPGPRERRLKDKYSLIVKRAARFRRMLRRQPPQWMERQTLRMLLSLDDLVQGAYNKLKELDEAENTLAFFVSDHGYFWGEHRLAKKTLPYREALEVPLYMRWPGHAPAGLRDRRVALNVDIAPTVYDALDIDPSYPVDGRSLLRRSRRGWAFSEHATRVAGAYYAAALRPGRWHYIEWYERGPTDRTYEFRELYDLREDPDELHNLFVDERGRPAETTRRVRRMGRRLHAQIRHARRCRGRDCP